MAERKAIGLRDVAALEPDSEIWDSTVVGFGARRQRSAAIAYVLLYRTAEGRQRRFTIGRHGSPWTPDTARQEARRLLGEVAGGKDPATTKKARRRAVTIAELCDDYLKDAEAGHVLKRDGKPKKASTLASDRGRIEGHIKPLLGQVRVEALAIADVQRFMVAVAKGSTAKRQKTKARGVTVIRGGKGTATRSVGTLGAILSFAITQGLRTDNPAHRVKKYAENRRQRRLSDGEYLMLGAALRKSAEQKLWPASVAAVHFLALSGWRSGEALALCWGEIDLVRRVATLEDTKTGQSVRPLSKAMCDLLRGLGVGKAATLVFPPTKGAGTMTGFRKFWLRIAKNGELPADITPHVLRHSFASQANDLHFTEATVAMMVGHRLRGTTGGYFHADDAVLLAASDKVADSICEKMKLGPVKGVVVELRANG